MYVYTHTCKYMCISHILFIPLSVDCFLGSFHTLAIMDKTMQFQMILEYKKREDFINQRTENFWEAQIFMYQLFIKEA